MTSVSHGKPCAGNPHARFEEGASAPESPRRDALLHKTKTIRVAIAAICVVAALLSWAADRTINADYTLTTDEAVDGVLSVAYGATVDLAGHNLTVKGLKGGGNPTLGNGRYQILEYVTADGTQCVQTDYTPFKYDHVETKLRHSAISL